MRWTDVDAREILEPPLNYKDLEMAFETSRPSVSAADSMRHEEWAKSVQRGVSQKGEARSLGSWLLEGQKVI